MEDFFSANHDSLNSTLRMFYVEFIHAINSYFQTNFNLDYLMHAKRNQLSLNRLGLKYLRVNHVSHDTNNATEDWIWTDEKIAIVAKLCKESAAKFGFEFFAVEYDDDGIPVFVIRYASCV